MAKDGADVGTQSNGYTHGREYVKFVPRSYDRNDSRSSALELVLTARPDWAGQENTIEIVRCTDGITNTLLKVANRKPDVSEHETDDDAVLLRAYGHGTDVIIDRRKETENHETLMRQGLAPELLARFENGMIYRYIRGTVTSPADLGKPAVSLAIARRLAQWHAVVPCFPDRQHQPRVPGTNGRRPGHGQGVGQQLDQLPDAIAPGTPCPNLWTVMQKWILVLPTDTKDQRFRQELLQKELHRVVGEFSGRPGLGKDGLVFAHCDLLSGNIIVLPPSGHAGDPDGPPAVSFIDYEYATPSPAAFDIANHFAEWAGFECDYGAMPTQAQRETFVREYVETYFRLAPDGRPAAGEPIDVDSEAAKLLHEVDGYRGIPGFYWGIWSSIQAVISDINFDYASYADLRLGEYWAWRAQREGTLEKCSPEMRLREAKWARAN